VEHLKGVSLNSPLLTNLRLGREACQGTNTLAYYGNASISDFKNLIKLGSGPNVIKLFSSVIYKCL
jgi:hypothetical protein